MSAAKLSFFRALAVALRSRGAVVSVAKVVALRSLAIGVNVLTGLLTAAALGPDGRGELAALTVAPLFLAGLGAVGLHAALIYNMKADPQREREYLGATLIMTCMTGFAIAGIGWVIEPYWLTRYSPDTVALGRVFLFTVPFTVMTYSLLGAAEAHGRFGFANRTLYLQSLGILVLLLVLMRLDLLTPGTAAAAYLAPAIPTFLYFAWQIVRTVRPVLTLRPPFPKQLLRYGLRYYGVDLLGTLSGYLDQLIIVALLAPRLVGAYSVALSMARLMTVLQTAATSVLFPSIAGRDMAMILQRLGATLRVVILITAMTVFVAGIAGPYLLTMLYGPRFEAAVGPFRVLLLDALVASSARVLYLAYSSSGRPEWVTGFEAAGVAVSIGSMLVLVPQFGLIGAACAVILASATRLTCCLAGFPLVLKVRMPRLLLNWSDVQAGLRTLRNPIPVMEDTAS